MSRADGGSLPASPRLSHVLRLAAADLYYHGVRLVPVNVGWGLIVLVGVLLASTPIVIVPLIALVPVSVGLMGMAATVVRSRTLVMSDFTESLRARLWPAVGIGIAQLLLVAITVVDLLIGLELGGVIGLVLVVVAIYTALAIWLLAVVTWPILTDPLRRELGTRGCLRLGLLLVVVHPVRIGLLALVVGVVYVASTILLAALLTFALAFGFLVCAHYVLPSADRLEGRATRADD